MVTITELTNLAVDLIDVRKTYGRSVQALRGVNVQVGRGEIFGLLGPNGAGKTTLVKIMMTAVRPSHALGTILGRPIGHRGKIARLGYLPEDLRFPRYLTGRQVLDFYAALARVPRQRRRENARRLLERTGMTAWADVRVDQYSRGMLQRVGIAQALMNDPEMVLLDEPTEGLDPIGRRSVRELLLELKRRGTTVFLNSHLLSELELVCDRVAILVDGMVARQGTLDELTQQTVEYRITLADALPSRDPTGAAGEPSRDRPPFMSRSDVKGKRAEKGGVAWLQFGTPAADFLTGKLEELGAAIDGTTIRIPGHDTNKLNKAIDLLRAQGRIIQSVQPHRFSLEDILVQVVRDQSTASLPPR